MKYSINEFNSNDAKLIINRLRVGKAWDLKRRRDIMSEVCHEVNRHESANFTLEMIEESIAEAIECMIDSGEMKHVWHGYFEFAEVGSNFTVKDGGNLGCSGTKATKDPSNQKSGRPVDVKDPSNQKPGRPVDVKDPSNQKSGRPVDVEDPSNQKPGRPVDVEDPSDGELGCKSNSKKQNRKRLQKHRKFLSDLQRSRCGAVFCGRTWGCRNPFGDNIGELSLQYSECDHIVPLCHGGLDDLSNLQVLCKTCHAFKSARQANEMCKVIDYRKFTDEDDTESVWSDGEDSEYIGECECSCVECECNCYEWEQSSYHDFVTASLGSDWSEDECSFNSEGSEISEETASSEDTEISEGTDFNCNNSEIWVVSDESADEL